MGTLRARRPSSILGYRCIQLRYFANQSINSEKKNLKFPLIANTKGRLGTKYYNIMFQPGTTVPHNSEEHRVLMSINVPMTAMLTATAAIPCNRNSAAPDGGPMGTLDQLGLGNDIGADDLSMYRHHHDDTGSHHSDFSEPQHWVYKPRPPRSAESDFYSEVQDSYQPRAPEYRHDDHGHGRTRDDFDVDDQQPNDGNGKRWHYGFGHAADGPPTPPPLPKNWADNKLLNALDDLDK